ncbi:MAG: radical SAM protein [Bacteroidota bacterium]
MFKTKKIQGIGWVDEFIENIREYVFVREEDNILIKQPNQATKINSTGTKIMKFLLNGGTTAELLKKTGNDKAVEIESFIIGVKNYLEGNLDEFSLNPAVETEPFALQFSKLPVLSELALTYKCNLQCKFCYAGCNCTVNPTGSNDELSLDEFKAVIKTIYQESRVPSISFTGGEPTLRPEILIACTEYAKSLGMRVNLITNGTLITPEYAQKLKDSGLDSVQVSIEGVTAETHDKLVQHKGAFEKSIRTVKLFKDLGLHVHTNSTLNKHNEKESRLLPDFVKNTLGLERFSMNLVIPAGSSIFNDDLVIKYSEVGPIILDIQKESKKWGVEFMWYSPIPMCMFNTITNELGNKGCAACDGLISVAPNGDILPCSSYDEPVGNLKDKEFPEIWQGDQAKYFRDKEYAHEICQSCEHLAVCNGACPLYWRNMGYDELIEAKKNGKINH